MMTLLTILLLVFMEGMLSFDNAIVLAVQANHLPEDQQKKALIYGMWGAIGFRALAMSALVFLIHAAWVKFAGAAYLFYLSISHAINPGKEDPKKKAFPGFWRTVILIELTDIAFSSDSILASIGISHDFWVLFVGATLGIIMMRFASMLFVDLIQKFPRLEETAYFLIMMIAAKLVTEGFGENWDSGVKPYCFMAVMALAIARGFMPLRETTTNT